MISAKAASVANATINKISTPQTGVRHTNGSGADKRKLAVSPVYATVVIVRSELLSILDNIWRHA